VIAGGPENFPLMAGRENGNFWDKLVSAMHCRHYRIMSRDILFLRNGPRDVPYSLCRSGEPSVVFSLLCTWVIATEIPLLTLRLLEDA